MAFSALGLAAFRLRTRVVDVRFEYVGFGSAVEAAREELRAGDVVRWTGRQITVVYGWMEGIYVGVTGHLDGSARDGDLCSTFGGWGVCPRWLRIF